MNHGKQDTRPSPGGKRHKQEAAPSKTEQQARGEDSGQEGFTKPPAGDSRRQPSATTEPERLSAKEEPVSEEQRYKRDHPPAQRSDRS
ncbi:MAG: hypothetical protein KY410_07315 [Proteobacteria bacterium]|nr:hypothetical protein [Pseudomonadota bacterium]